MQRTNLKGLARKELQEFAESLGESPYRGGQLFAWIYGKKAQSFDDMTDLAKEFRSLLARSATLENLTVARQQTSAADGTTKFLFMLGDGLMIESVLIPAEQDSPGAEKRLTLCLSTQVGCPLDCKFCATGTMGFFRNLTAGEIVDQVIQAQLRSPKRITNLVYMGMGEPMLNYDSVMKSIDIITDDHSLNIGPRRITVSTAGYADKIRQMADEQKKVKLALSLHSLDDRRRQALMPINKKFNVAALLDALDYYYRRIRQRPTFEYILFAGYNDREEDLRLLIEVSKRIPSKINIIPFHSIEFTHPTGVGATLQAPTRERIEAFAQQLRRAHVTVMVRSSAGEDIDAACGQLAVKEKAASPSRKRKGPSSLPHPHHSPATA